MKATQRKLLILLVEFGIIYLLLTKVNCGPLVVSSSSVLVSTQRIARKLVCLKLRTVLSLCKESGHPTLKKNNYLWCKLRITRVNCNFGQLERMKMVCSDKARKSKNARPSENLIMIAQRFNLLMPLFTMTTQSQLIKMVFFGLGVATFNAELDFQLRLNKQLLQ